MPYIGNQLATQFQAFATQTITGDGSTGYTLDRAVANGKELLVYINNVKQEEGSGKSYTATGTTITFSAAVTSDDSCYVVFLGSAVQTVNPPDASVGSSQLASSIDFQNITIKGGSTNAMTIDSSGRILTPARPAFQARGSNDAYVTTNPIPFPTAEVNIGSCYNTSTYKFTAPIAGIYYFYASVYNKLTAGEYNNIQFSKNDSTDYESAAGSLYATGGGSVYGTNPTIAVLSLSASDTIKVAFHSSTGDYYNGEDESVFGGFLLG
jgi:hypothetical protein